MMKGEWFLEKQGKPHFNISFPAPVYMPSVATCSESFYNIRYPHIRRDLCGWGVPIRRDLAAEIARKLLPYP